MTDISSLCYIDAVGFHFPDYPTVLAWYEDNYKGVYGQDIYIDPDSQDGQWIAIQAKAAYDTMALAANVYNSFSPTFAQSDALSRNVKINGIRRGDSTHSTVELDIGGIYGTVITNGIASDTGGNKWALPASVTIPIAGTITVTATAVEPGNITALANTVTTIATPTRGWQTVNNPNAAIAGEPVESDGDLRLRQSRSTSLPALSVFESTIGAVWALPGVTRLKGYENDTGSTDANGIPAHSISLVVDGGVTQDIGNAIARKKTPGTRTYGTTNVTTYDQYGVPNTIHFYRPTAVAIGVKFTLTALAGWTTGYEDLIKQAIADYINALNIGDDVYIAKLFTPANLLGTVAGGTYDIDLSTFQINKNAGAFAASNITIAFNEAATCVVGDITITVI